MRPRRPGAASVLLLGILAAAAVIAPSPARATMSLSAYEAAASDPAQRALRKSHLLGALDGLDLTNRVLVAGGAQPLFCRPSDRPITAERAEAILDRYLGDNPDIGHQKTLPIVDVLMLALEEIYPCR